MGATCSEEGSRGEPTLSVATTEDAKLEAAITTNVLLFAVTLVVYTVLHWKHPQWYYKNYYKRGFGPDPPATGGLSGAWGWVVLVMRMPLDEVEMHAGSDARVLLEFIALSMKALTAYALVTPLQLAAYLVASYQEWIDKR